MESEKHVDSKRPEVKAQKNPCWHVGLPNLSTILFPQLSPLTPHVNASNTESFLTV